MSVAVHVSDVSDFHRGLRTGFDKRLAYAVGGSVLMHALAMALAPGFRARTPLAPRPLDVAIVTLPQPEPPQQPPKVEPPRPLREKPPPRVRHPPKTRPEARVQPRVEPAVVSPTPALAPSPQPSPVLALPQTVPNAAPFTVPPSAGDSNAPTANAKPAPAAPAAPAASAREAPLPATPPVFNAAYLGNAPPRYPLIARRSGVEGTVLLNVLVTTDGRASRVHVEKSSGSSALDNAALDAVKGWRFVPARRGQEAIEQSVAVPIVFRLEGTS
jgi:protein TonB